MKNKFTIAVIGAMECEVNQLKSKLKNKQVFSSGDLKVYKGEMHAHNVIVAQSGVGKVNAALRTQYITHIFKPDYIINTGIAGAIANDSAVGDIVIGEKLVQYDFDVSAIGYAKGYMCTGVHPEKPTIFYSDKKLIAEFEKAMLKSSPLLRLKKGIIASGDTFISDINKKKEIRELFNADAAEMEGAAIAQCASVNKVPFVIIRAISDLADNNAAQEHKFTEKEMAELCSSSIENLLMNI